VGRAKPPMASKTGSVAYFTRFSLETLRPCHKMRRFTSETSLEKVCVALDVARPFNNGMSSDEILVYVNADTGFFKGSNTPLIVDCKRQTAELVPEEIFARYIRLEVATVVNCAEEMDGGRHIDTRRRCVWIDR
jgi:hypothetical protein